MKNKIELIQQGVNQTRDILYSNIDKFVGNLENLDDLRQKAEKLKEAALVFKKQSARLKHEAWYKSYKLHAYIFVGLLLATTASILLLLGQLGIMSTVTAVLISVALICVTTAIAIGIDLYRNKNPHGFFMRNHEDKGHQVPSAKLEKN